MKSAGLSSKFKRTFRQTTKMTAYANVHQIHLSTKEREKSLRLQAERARLEKMKEASKAAVEELPITPPQIPSL